VLQNNISSAGQFDFIYYDKVCKEEYQVQPECAILSNISSLLTAGGNFMIVCNWSQYNYLMATLENPNASFDLIPDQEPYIFMHSDPDIEPETYPGLTGYKRLSDGTTRVDNPVLDEFLLMSTAGKSFRKLKTVSVYQTHINYF